MRNHPHWVNFKFAYDYASLWNPPRRYHHPSLWKGRGVRVQEPADHRPQHWCRVLARRRAQVVLDLNRSHWSYPDSGLDGVLSDEPLICQQCRYRCADDLSHDASAEHPRPCSRGHVFITEPCPIRVMSQSAWNRARSIRLGPYSEYPDTCDRVRWLLDVVQIQDRNSAELSLVQNQPIREDRRCGLNRRREVIHVSLFVQNRRIIWRQDQDWRNGHLEDGAELSVRADHNHPLRAKYV